MGLPAVQVGGHAGQVGDAMKGYEFGGMAPRVWTSGL